MGGAPLTGYHVTSGPLGAECQTNATTRSCTLICLTPSTAFPVTIVALNSAGAGSPASVTASTTALPVGAPKVEAELSSVSGGEPVRVIGSGFAVRQELLVGLVLPDGTPASRGSFSERVTGDEKGAWTWVFETTRTPSQADTSLSLWRPMAHRSRLDSRSSRVWKQYPRAPQSTSALVNHDTRGHQVARAQWFDSMRPCSCKNSTPAASPDRPSTF